MGKLETATPKFGFTLGFLLLGFFPSDLLTSIAIGAHLANHGDPGGMRFRSSASPCSSSACPPYWC